MVAEPVEANKKGLPFGKPLEVINTLYMKSNHSINTPTYQCGIRMMMMYLIKIFHFVVTNVNQKNNTKQLFLKLILVSFILKAFQSLITIGLRFLQICKYLQMNCTSAQERNELRLALSNQV